jgi:hypothetical protein
VGNDQDNNADEQALRESPRGAALTSDDPLTDVEAEMDDLSAIQMDDVLLDALGSDDADRAGMMGDGELTALLRAWRQDVDAEAHGELVDLDTAVATVEAAARAPRVGRHRLLIPLASAAAVLVIAFSGVSLAARDAQPGDTLWGLTQVLYSDHAKSVEAAVAVRTDLDSARLALRDGRLSDAKEALAKAGASLPSVAPDEGKDALTAKHEELVAQLTGSVVVPSMSAAPSSSVPVSSSSASTSQATSTAPTTTTAPVSSTAPSTSSSATPDVTTTPTASLQSTSASGTPNASGQTAQNTPSAGPGAAPAAGDPTATNN